MALLSILNALLLPGVAFADCNGCLAVPIYIFLSILAITFLGSFLQNFYVRNKINPVPHGKFKKALLLALISPIILIVVASILIFMAFQGFGLFGV